MNFYTCQCSEQLRAGLGPGKNSFSGSRSKSRLAKNLDPKSERLTFSGRVTCAWPERVNFYNRQIIILPRKTKT
jgi:hypothetical protein